MRERERDRIKKTERKKEKKEKKEKNKENLLLLKAMRNTWDQSSAF